ncbi:MAG: orotate phosphoribosyltransferase [Euryarchaeota archaeon]|jgi:orotate phosphoribosyltransferase|nr:orotate phosphoribosyltransferase [Euryarchaeota archaeon]
MSVHPSLKSMPEWERLVEMVRELAFLDGGSDDAFTLASGRSSRWFFDMKPVMMHTESAKLLSTLFNHRLDDLDPVFVGGLELGAVPLTAIVITGSESDKRKGFMVRKSPKGRGGRKTNNPPGIEGASIAQGGNVVILEDVTTTGGSSIKAVERIHENTSCNVIAVISILDREEGGVEAFAEAGIPFESILSRSDITN